MSATFITHEVIQALLALWMMLSRLFGLPGPEVAQPPEEPDRAASAQQEHADQDSGV